VQHIFVYSGHPNGPAGVFRITRTLNTPQLVATLNESDEAEALPVPQTLTKGGVVLTFDDRNFGDWVSAIPLFNKFDAKATFFISGKIDVSAIDAIQQMKTHGHVIGSHSVHHLKAVEFCEERSTEEFVRLEIQPQMEEFKAAGVIPSSFAYPMSRNNSVTDEALLKEFRHLQTGKIIKASDKISEDDAFFVPATKMSEHGCLYAKGIDFAGERPNRTFEQIDAALLRVARNQEIIVLYAHHISETCTRRGPHRKKGERLPDAKSWEEDSSHWSTHHFDQYGLHGSLQTKTNTGLYYKAGNDRLLRLVLSRDTVGDCPTRLFYSTNVDLKAREILSLFSLRWSIEVTHFDCKQHLGLEDAANRKEEAVKRTARMAMFLHSLTVVWYATDGHRDFQIPVRPSYWWKTEPSFADMLTTLRRKSREDKLSTVSLDTTQREDNLNLLTYLATLAG
jgi:hypothetical protein